MGIKFTDIDGFCGYGKLYEEIIESAQEGATIVELGSFKGRSTSYLLELANKSGKQLSIYAVDHFQGSEEHAKIDYFSIFKNNMDNLEFKYPYITIQKNSVEASKEFADKSIDFMMIDASHDYDNVKRDILCWMPKIKAGGMLAGDDYDWPGVSAAVNELLPDRLVFPRTGGDCKFDIYAGNYWVKTL